MSRLTCWWSGHDDQEYERTFSSERAWMMVDGCSIVVQGVTTILFRCTRCRRQRVRHLPGHVIDTLERMVR